MQSHWTHEEAPTQVPIEMTLITLAFNHTPDVLNAFVALNYPNVQQITEAMIDELIGNETMLTLFATGLITKNKLGKQYTDSLVEGIIYRLNHLKKIFFSK